MNWLRTTGLRLALALGLSFSLWLFVSFSENPFQSASFNGVPTEIRGLPSNVVVVDNNGLLETSLPAVNVTVEADAQTLQRHVQSSNIHAFVDLRDKGPGEYLVPVVAETNRSDLSGLNFSAIAPRNLSIRLEQLVTETVPLQVKTDGNLPFSFEAGATQVSVNEQPLENVAVSGPQGRIAQVHSVQAVANIEQLRADYTASVKIQPLNENGQLVEGVTTVPDTVRVRVPIRSVAGLRRVAVLSNTTGWPANGYVVSTITSNPQLVNLTGSSGPLDAVNQIETEPVDITGATTTITRAVNLLVPIGTSLQSGEASRVTVTVQIESLARPFRVTLPAPVTASGVSNGLIVSVNPAVVQLPLVGSSGALNQLTGTGLQGTVNLTGRGPGTYTLAPEVTLPASVRLAGPIPEVTVVVRAAATVPVPTVPPSTATPAPLRPSEAPTSATPPANTTAGTSDTQTTINPSDTPVPPPEQPTDTPAPPGGTPGATSGNGPAVQASDILSANATPSASTVRTFITPEAPVAPVTPTPTPGK